MEFVSIEKRRKGRPRPGETPKNPSLDLLQEVAAAGGRVSVDVVLIAGEWHAFSQCVSAGIGSMAAVMTSHKTGAVAGAQLWNVIDKIMSKVPSAAIRIVVDRRVWVIGSLDRRREVICYAVENSTGADVSYVAELLEIDETDPVRVRSTIINALDYCAGQIPDEVLVNVLGAFSIPEGVVK